MLSVLEMMSAERVFGEACYAEAFLAIGRISYAFINELE
jgi:hypothetical protein